MRVVLSAVVVPISVALSFGVAFLGSYVTICLCEQLRIVCLGQNSSKLFGRKGLLFLMSIALGGGSICGMHFVAMCGTKLVLSDGVTGINLGVDLFGIILTLFCVILCSFLGLYTSSFDKVFTKTKSEVIEMFVQEASTMSIGAIKKLKSSKILFIICTHYLTQLIAGGVFIGIGCFLMHYIGSVGLVATYPMESTSAVRRALSVASDTTLSPSYPVILLWDGGILSASILVGFLLSIGSVWILYRLLSLYPNREVLRLSSSLLMAGASCSMHWVCMSSATFVMTDNGNTNVTLNTAKVEPLNVFNSFLTGGVLMSVGLFILVLSDLRAWLFATTLNLQRADELIAELSKDTKLANSALMVTYNLKRRMNSTVSFNNSSTGTVGSSDKASGNNAEQSLKSGEAPNTKDSAWFSQFIYRAPTPSSKTRQQQQNRNNMLMRNNKVAIDAPASPLAVVEMLSLSKDCGGIVEENYCGGGGGSSKKTTTDNNTTMTPQTPLEIETPKHHIQNNVSNLSVDSVNESTGSGSSSNKVTLSVNVN